MTIFTATKWTSNAELIADVAKLGYLDGDVLDVTYGLGTFWKQWRPEHLTACDINPTKSPIGYSVDFTHLPFGKLSFDAVVLDPPYKLNGTPTEEVDDRYGVHIVRSWQYRLQLIELGILECSQVARRYLLLKCQDQVCAGQKRWQTYQFTKCGEACGLILVDRFDMLGTPRPQPAGRRQVHTQVNYSTLLVFRKGDVR